MQLYHLSFTGFSVSKNKPESTLIFSYPIITLSINLQTQTDGKKQHGMNVTGRIKLTGHLVIN